jgi:hypothetical protein
LHDALGIWYDPPPDILLGMLADSSGGGLFLWPATVIVHSNKVKYYKQNY